MKSLICRIFQRLWNASWTDNDESVIIKDRMIFGSFPEWFKKAKKYHQRIRA
jgi:hypothetical protein